MGTSLRAKFEDHFNLTPKMHAKLELNAKPGRVLVVGSVLCQQTNHYSNISKELSQSRIHEVQQVWGLIKPTDSSQCSSNVTELVVEYMVPRSILINRLLKQGNYHEFDHVIVIDDDIRLPRGFLDQFIEAQTRLDFAIAQPARTINSRIAHKITKQVPHLLARQTHFVEIGPLVSFRKDVFKLVLPLDEASPMGWGHDLVWPVLLCQQGRKMGIIDFAPVAHTLRPLGKSYTGDDSRAKMNEYLGEKDHMNFKQAWRVIAEFTDDNIG